MNRDLVFNEKLKFSWGHIIAVIALIAIAYCTFVGTVYLLYKLLAGNTLWVVSSIITLVVVALLGALFFIPQQLKGTERRFEKRIKWERAFIFASPFLFLLLMVPFSHAWTVHFHQKEILDQFDAVVEKTGQMFDDYETYSNRRIENYALQLQDNSSMKDYTRENRTDILRLALLSSNYDSLKHSAKDWMVKNSNSPTRSTWNIFLLGNTHTIQEAIQEWHQQLKNFSQDFSWDDENFSPWDNDNAQMNDIDETIDTKMTSYYTNIIGFNPIMILWLVLGYAMLIFPYILQHRHSKTIGTQWSLFRTKKNKTTSHSHNDDDYHYDDTDDDNSQPYRTTPPPLHPVSDEGDDDYSSVKI